MSYVLCHVMSYVKCPVMSYEHDMSYVMSYVKCPMSCHVMSWTCHVLCQMSYVKCPMSCHMNICPSIWTDNCCRDFDLTTRGLHPKCEPRPPPQSSREKTSWYGPPVWLHTLLLWSHKQWERSIVSLLDASPTLSGKIGWEPVLPPPSFPSPIAAVIQC